jgi:hypothetical protein
LELNKLKHLNNLKDSPASSSGTVSLFSTALTHLHKLSSPISQTHAEFYIFFFFFGIQANTHSQAVLSSPVSQTVAKAQSGTNTKYPPDGKYGFPHLKYFYQNYYVYVVCKFIFSRFILAHIFDANSYFLALCWACGRG